MHSAAKHKTYETLPSVSSGLSKHESSISGLTWILLCFAPRFSIQEMYSETLVKIPGYLKPRSTSSHLKPREVTPTKTSSQGLSSGTPPGVSTIGPPESPRSKQGH